MGRYLFSDGGQSEVEVGHRLSKGEVGRSMEPLFRSNGDVILFDRTARRRSGFKRGDVRAAAAVGEELRSF